MREGWRPAGAEFKPLGLTLEKPHQGKLGWEEFSAGVYPSCSEHGAMNKVAKAPLWRCLNCNIGGELVVQLEFGVGHAMADATDLATIAMTRVEPLNTTE